MKSHLVILSFFFASLELTLLGQTSQYYFSKIDINHGLSHNQVNCIYKDSKGFMWFGTMSGLNRYDGYNFKIFRHSLKDSLSIDDDFIYRIVEDPKGKLWITTRNGICIYDPITETFTRSSQKYLSGLSVPSSALTGITKDEEGNIWFLNSRYGLYKYMANGRVINIHHSNSHTSISSNNIASIIQNSQGHYWLIQRDGLLEKMDKNNYQITDRIYILKKMLPTGSSEYELFADADDDLWVLPANMMKGVFYINTRNKSVWHFHTKASRGRLSNNVVRNIIQDDKGVIWVGTDHGGINLINKQNFTVSYLLNHPDDDKSLIQNSITALYKDNTGIIWVGTYKKGINYYHENMIRFRLFRHKSSDPNSLPYDDVNCFAEDEQHNLWIGTNGGGLIYFDRSRGTFTTYKHQPENPAGLSSDVLVCLYKTPQQLWIGTYLGGLNVFDGKKFKTYHHTADPNSLSDNRVWRIFEDSQHHLRIGTLGGGLDLFDREKQVFYHYKDRYPDAIQSDYITALLEDSEGNTWIGTADGIDVQDKRTGRFTHFMEGPDAGSLSKNNVICITEDSRKWIWVGTRDGLNLYHKDKHKFRIFRTEDGLPDNTILSILEDNRRHLWLSTPNGLCNIDITKVSDTSYTFSFKNYDESDGLQGKQFNEGAAFKTQEGELIFGGANGFNSILPDDLKENKIKPTVVLTDFQIFNESIKANKKFDGRVILQKTITETTEITLKHNENIFTIEFAALNYFHPEKNKYLYKLENFNKDWMKADGKVRKATYTNLNPGEYIFKVKASNNDNLWNEDGVQLKITVLPPFWRTNLAIVIYIILITGVLLLSRHLMLERERLNYRIEQEHLEAQRNHELDMMKIRFFTNISHEFRTPLTLIITPIEKILKQTQNIEQQKQFLLIYRNARRLLNLVNQLLDFRRMEVHEIKLTLSQGDIIGFIKDISYSFSDIYEKRKIRFSFTSSIHELEMFFDQDKVEKILFNLLSNAFKFTPEHGSVSVETLLQNKNRNESAGEDDSAWLEIKVRDTGIGIHEDKHEKIFERFFQNELPGNLINQGSGIGLAITKEFVKLHGGFITLESTPGKGSCFTVLLPLLNSSVKSPLIENNPPTGSPEEYDNVAISNKKNVILLVEDYDEFRFYLKDNLKHNYVIMEAVNGMEGWKKTLSVIPDLVVTDVMMPEMNGIDLCKKIKTDPRTSHIPVVLLTAKNTEEEKVQGFHAGADDYITKPFNFEILESRIKNLVSQRESLRKVFQKQLMVNPSEINITSLDEKLIQKALNLVEKNMSNPDFSVEELSKELGMSRVHLYKKLLSLTGQSPIEFIRIIRLKRAAQLLKKSQLSVSEIAYQVGFNNPKYFTKYFKNEFGILPSIYASKHENEDMNT